ncbi:MAG: pyridoxamine 5'-phosphate oxidase family protein [Candidatus Moraniibacteriota bacterium]
MSQNYEEKAKRILSGISYATVATVTPEGKAWNSPVAHDMDENHNIYWFSDKENEHSKNIRNNPSIFIVIYDSTAPDGEGEGVYIEALAEELTNEVEIDTVLRINPNNKEKGSDFLGENVRRCYKAIPQRMWLNDAEEKDGVFIRDYRVEIDLLKEA